MAIDPSTLYSSQIITSDAGWPYGRPQNDSVPGDGSGTPLEEAWVSDLFGWQQALLGEASITPSGNPDEVGASQYMTALHGLFANKSVETRMPDDPLATPVNRVGLILPSDCYPGNVAEWTRDVDHWEATAVSGSVILSASRTVPKGFSLTSVSAYFSGPTHTTYPPANFPTIIVYRARITSGSLEALAQSTMTPVSQAVYEARGIWTMNVSPDGVFYEDYDHLIFTFAPEYGTNALAGTKVYGATIYGTVDRARVL
jgi:hypothetical protein